MITDHSSIGFEYLVLDRPLIVFDAPDLPEAARINPEKVVLLRSAATVVGTTDQLTGAAIHALDNPADLSAARRMVAGALFFDPGHATARAVELLRGLVQPGAGAIAAKRRPERVS
jgi:CDP-glycerol glycerophosphotransferase (TagB/SpsB family)